MMDKESKLLRKNDRFELREIDVTETTGDDTCEVCAKEYEKILYRLKGEYKNCDMIICKECLEKLKNIVNYFE